MKKIIHIGFIIAMMFLAASTRAQNKISESKQTDNSIKTANTYLELMVNVVRTNLNYGGANSALSDYKKSGNGIQAGISFQAGVTSRLSLVSELYYLRKGGKLKSDNPLNKDASSLHLNTLELPLLARLHLGKFYINAGPSIAYNLGGKNKIGDRSTKISFDNSAGGFRRFDAGVQMGGGVEFPFKQKRISLDVRYNYGLTDIAYEKEIYNRAFMISVHFSKPWKTNPLQRNKRL